MKPKLFVSLLGVACATASVASAIDYVWNGSVDTDWATSGNWTPGGVPVLNGTNNAVVDGAVVYNAGGDFQLATGSALTINSGGSWVQTGGISWIQLNGGTLNLNGGSFNMGTAGNINVGGAGGTLNIGGSLILQNAGLTMNANTTLTLSNGGSISGTFNQGSGSVYITGGVFSSSGNYVIGGADTVFQVSGGVVTFGGEFKPNLGENVIISGGVVNATLISFDSIGESVLTLAGGRINLSQGNVFNGIFSAGADDYINFTSVSSQLFIDNLSLGGAEALLGGLVRYNGVADSSMFNLTAQGDGYLFTLVGVPEPSAAALLAGLGVLGGAVLRRRRRA